MTKKVERAAAKLIEEAVLRVTWLSGHCWESEHRNRFWRFKASLAPASTGSQRVCSLWPPFTQTRKFQTQRKAPNIHQSFRLHYMTIVVVVFRLPLSRSFWRFLQTIWRKRKKYEHIYMLYLLTHEQCESVYNRIRNWVTIPDSWLNKILRKNNLKSI